MSLRTFVKSAIALVWVSLCAYAVEIRLHSRGVPSRDVMLLSDLAIGFFAAVLMYVLSAREQQRREYVDARLRVIAEMNHHVRNALQVITFYSAKGQKQEIGIVEAVERIQWALREVLPQIPDLATGTPLEEHTAGITTAEMIRSRR